MDYIMIIQFICIDSNLSSIESSLVGSVLTAEFLLAHHLNVSQVTNTSATFMWTHTAENNVHHIRFKVILVPVVEYM